MTQVTLEAVQAKQSELAAMIEQLQQQAAKRTLLVVPEAEIELQAGEHYAGTVLDENGHVKHHVVLMAAKPDGRLTWQGAMDWAASVGGELPSRQEQALLYANCKSQFEAEWYWSNQQHETNGSSAWHCNFGNGNQTSNHESFEGCARAVRRV
jgi:hypothetical protein